MTFFWRMKSDLILVFSLSPHTRVQECNKINKVKQCRGGKNKQCMIKPVNNSYDHLNTKSDRGVNFSNFVSTPINHYQGKDYISCWLCHRQRHRRGSPGDMAHWKSARRLYPCRHQNVASERWYIPRGTRGGGVSLLLKSGFSARLNTSSRYDSFEYINYGISLNASSLRLINLYRKQEIASRIFFNDFSSLLESVIL